MMWEKRRRIEIHVDILRREDVAADATSSRRDATPVWATHAAEHAVYTPFYQQVGSKGGFQRPTRLQACGAGSHLETFFSKFSKIHANPYILVFRTE